MPTSIAVYVFDSARERGAFTAGPDASQAECIGIAGSPREFSELVRSAKKHRKPVVGYIPNNQGGCISYNSAHKRINARTPKDRVPNGHKKEGNPIGLHLGSK